MASDVLKLPTRLAELLGDVATAGATDRQPLAFDLASSKWKPITLASTDISGLGTAATNATSAFDLAGAAAAVGTSLVAHAADHTNPHAVTATQIGLGNLANALQLVAANNLSDLASASAARTNLGLGTAATANTGTNTGQVPLFGVGVMDLGANLLKAASGQFSGTVSASSYVGSGSSLTGLTTSQITGLGTAAAANTGTAVGAVPLFGAAGAINFGTGLASVGSIVVSGTSSLAGDVTLGTGVLNAPAGLAVLIQNGHTASFRLLPFGNDIYFQNTVNSGNILFTGANGAVLTGNVTFNSSGTTTFGGNVTLGTKTLNAGAGQFSGSVTAGSLAVSGTSSLAGTASLSNGASLNLYNTADQTVNYERLNVGWSANSATIQTQNGGTGVGRPLVLQAGGNSTVSMVGGGTSLSVNRTSLPWINTYWNSTSASGNMMQAGGTSTAASGTYNGLAIVNTYQQSGSAGGTDFLISRTNTSTGSGPQNLVIGQTGGSDQFRFPATGGLQVNGVDSLATGTSLSLQSRSLTAAGTAVSMATGSFTASSGQQVGVAITPTINQTLTSYWTGLLVNPTVTASGNGGNLNIADFQVNGVSALRVNSAGNTVCNNITSQGNDTPLNLGGTRTFTASGNAIVNLAASTFSHSSGVAKGVRASPTDSTTLTGGVTAFEVDLLGSGTGSSPKLLLDLKAAGVSKHTFDKAGNATMTGNVTFGGTTLSFTNTGAVTFTRPVGGELHFNADSVFWATALGFTNGSLDNTTGIMNLNGGYMCQSNMGLTDSFQTGDGRTVDIVGGIIVGLE